MGGKEDSEIMEVAEQTRPADDRVESVQVVVPVGGGSFHHGMTMHGSRGSDSSRPRIAISLHYAAEECRRTDGRLNWASFVWEGVGHGDRITNEFMPVVFSTK